MLSLMMLYPKEKEVIFKEGLPATMSKPSESFVSKSTLSLRKGKQDHKTLKNPCTYTVLLLARMTDGTDPNVGQTHSPTHCELAILTNHRKKSLSHSLFFLRKKKNYQDTTTYKKFLSTKKVSYKKLKKGYTSLLQHITAVTLEYY